MTVWSIDPGERIGFCEWTDDGLPRDQRILTRDELIELMLNVEPPKVIIAEQWAHQPGKTKGGDRALTARILGMLELYSIMHDTDLVMQPAANLRVWALHAGVKVGTGHIKDDVAAFLHGHHWFVDQGILSTVVR